MNFMQKMDFMQNFITLNLKNKLFKKIKSFWYCNFFQFVLSKTTQKLNKSKKIKHQKANTFETSEKIRNVANLNAKFLFYLFHNYRLTTFFYY